MLLETDRLELKEVTVKDATFILELVNTPGWLKYIGDRGIKTEEDAKDYIEKKILNSFSENGFGAYVMILKDNGVAVGTCGLYKRPDLDHPDIGFALLPKYEKKGYAYEAASALMEHVKTKFGIRTILAITLEINTKSVALLKKIGLKKIDTITIKGDDEELLLFST